MPFKRFKSFSRGFARKRGIFSGKKVSRAAPGRKRKRGSSIGELARKVRRITKTIETKSGVRTINDGVEFQHNNLYTISSTFLGTTAGITDNENNVGTRIGDKITLVGVSFTMMLELNERYTDVTFRLLVVRSAKGDTPTTSTLWQGASGNKMLDTFNNERFSMLHSKYVKITARNQGNTPNLIQEIGSGFQVGTNTVSRATRIVKFFVPGRKFTRNGILQYEGGTTQPKFFDYHFIIYAYSNFSTVETFNVGRLNDCFIKIHYKDA